MTKLPVLIVEDDRDLLEALCATLRLAGHTVLAAPDAETALNLVQEQPVGLVLSDVQMRPMDGFVLLQKIKALNPALPVLLMTAYGEIGKAVAAMRAGACDYLLKPFEPASLLAQVERYVLPVAGQGVAGVIARDPRTAALLSLAQRVATSAATVMLTGESGSGKEVLARFIHRHSGRAARPFVAINCAAIPENLLEATLFGYEKGAFTGATQSQPGKFEQAQGGTLLLDEISEMPLALQAKLLRVLQEKEVERVGGRKAIALDVRLLATSNRDMEAMVARGGFREDLYYRLNVFPIVISPLRERPLDIVPLAQHILAGHGGRPERGSVMLTEAAAVRLMEYPWPGNVRELENVIHRAMILAPGDAIEVEHLNLPQCAVAGGGTQPGNGATPAPLDIKSLERAHIMETLVAVNGSRKLAVQRLGISERTLRYKLQQYRLAACA
jgi:two-component system response regulator FlrC